MRVGTRSQPKAGGSFWLAVVGVVAFLATAATIQRLVGIPDVGLLDDKLTYFARHKDTFDTLFFGSSRIYRGIDPTVFDGTRNARGQPTRSFNFGIAGMATHEANALIRRVLRLQPARLRWVVVEAGDWDPVINVNNRLKRRGILWHDAPETVSAVRSTLLLNAPPATRADLLLTHMLHFAAHATAAGRGLDLLSGKAARKPRDFEQRGFRPYSRRSYDTHPMRRDFLNNLEGYRSAVTALPAANAVEVLLHGYNMAALTAQVAMIRSVGAEPVHIIPPAPRATPVLYRLAHAGIIPRLLAFNDPNTYPELFAIAQRFDREHLTAEGAAEFSRHLAASFNAGVPARHQGWSAADVDGQTAPVTTASMLEEIDALPGAEGEAAASKGNR